MNPLTKKHIRSFLNKVGYKAVQAVNKEYEQKYEETFLTLLNSNKELIPLLHKANKLAKEFTEIESKILSILKDNLGMKKRGYYSKFEKLKDFSTVQEIKEDYICEVLKEVEKEKQQKIEDTKEAYRIVENRVLSMTPKKAREYLNSIGFDTSWLDTVAEVKLLAAPVDTEKLFPCKEKGV